MKSKTYYFSNKIMDTEEGKKITLVSSDGEKIEISRKAVQRSVVVKEIIQD